MKSNFTRFALVGLVALSSLTLTACSDEEVALSAGVLIGAAISDGHHHRPYPRPYPRHRPVRRHRYFAADASSVAQMSDANKAAMHYGVSVEAADQILTALKSAKEKNLAPIEALGFERADLSAIARGENPSASTLVTVSRNLGLEFDQAHTVIQQMKTDLGNGANR
ncbi:MAG: hypothetical protein U1E10_06705 [Bdellovibrionales bacterium]|nr:hypothetical protein [Bdellovibrionales bacterium]